jgi:hypothetical protein
MQLRVTHNNNQEERKILNKSKLPDIKDKKEEEK